MSKKYEFTGETITIERRTLHRIRSLIDIEDFDIKVGDVGGWIESERNLSHVGMCWVFKNACVFGDARVHGNARVFGDSRVSGDSRVFGNAHVYDNAHVYGNSYVYGNTWVYNNAHVHGDSRVFGNARVCGNASVNGDVHVGGDARITSTDNILTIGPATSSGRFTTAFKDSEIGIRVTTGCFTGTTDEFLDAIEETHKDNEKALKQYRAFHATILASLG